MSTTPTALDEATAMFDAHCLETFGYEFSDYVVIPESAPVASVREAIRDYVGPEVKATMSDINGILEALDGADWFRDNGFRFFEPNQFIVAVAVTIEL